MWLIFSLCLRKVCDSCNSFRSYWHVLQILHTWDNDPFRSLSNAWHMFSEAFYKTLSSLNIDTQSQKHLPKITFRLHTPPRSRNSFRHIYTILHIISPYGVQPRGPPDFRLVWTGGCPGAGACVAASEGLLWGMPALAAPSPSGLEEHRASLSKGMIYDCGDTGI